VVLNNAGFGGRQFYGPTKSSDWKSVIDVCLTAVIEGTEIAIEQMRERGKGGVIINVASMAGLTSMPLDPVYAAAKHGVVGFTKSLGHLKDVGIRVNAICPSFTDTPLVSSEKNETFRKFVAALGILSPKLVAEGIYRLVTDETLAGELMRVTQKNGIDFARYDRSPYAAVPKLPLSKL